MTATDELRKMLDERGVEWRDTGKRINLWNGIRIPIQTEYEQSCGGRWSVATEALSGTFNVNNLTPEQVIAATLGSGKLTAEQVMAIAGKHQPDYCSDTHVCFDWQAIADELNVMLGSEREQ